MSVKFNGIIRPRACTFRYRVFEVIGGHEADPVGNSADGEEGTLDSSVAFSGSGSLREFKDLAAAERYQEKLSKQSRHPVAMQVGVMQWLSNEEAGEWGKSHEGDYWE